MIELGSSLQFAVHSVAVTVVHTHTHTQISTSADARNGTVTSAAAVSIMVDVFICSSRIALLNMLCTLAWTSVVAQQLL